MAELRDLPKMDRLLAAPELAPLPRELARRLAREALDEMRGAILAGEDVALDALKDYNADHGDPGTGTALDCELMGTRNGETPALWAFGMLAHRGVWLGQLAEHERLDKLEICWHISHNAFCLVPTFLSLDLAVSVDVPAARRLFRERVLAPAFTPAPSPPAL